MNTISTITFHLAQAELDTVIQEGTTQIMAFALVIAIGGIIGAGFQLMRGEILHAIYILLGALSIGGSVAIANAFFSLAGVN